MKEILQLIWQHDVFANLTKEELNSLAPIIHRKVYKTQELVFDTNHKANYLFFIESGQLGLTLPNNEHKFLEKGQLFGEIGIINSDFRTGMVTALEPTKLIAICGTKLFKKEHIQPEIALKIVTALSKRITNYLRSKEQISTKEIIEQGESDQVEFKSTLRWNLYANKKDKAIESAALKTVAAFMNSNGGTLIIGVEDDGNILGLANDKFQNNDKLLLHLTSLIKNRMGAVHNQSLHVSIESINQKEILRIDCSPTTTPVYLKDGNLEHFYIRTGPSTTDLRLSKVFDYIKKRFENN